MPGAQTYNDLHVQFRRQKDELVQVCKYHAKILAIGLRGDHTDCGIGPYGTNRKGAIQRR